MDIIKQKTLGEYEEQLNREGNAYSRIASLFDAGTFVELGRFVKHEANEFGSENCDFEGVVTGYGAVEGKLVFVYSQDFSRMKGAVGSAHAKKIAKIYDMAIKSGAPVVGIIDTAGAKIAEGVGALTGYGEIISASAKASGVIPQIAVVCGICSGAMAVVASMADFTIGAKNEGKFFIAPPFNLGDKSGTIELGAKNGSVSIVEENDKTAVKTAKKLIAYLPSNNVEGTAYNETADVAVRETLGTTATEIAKSTLDCGSETEIMAEYGAPVKAYIGSVNGLSTGVVVVDGKLTPAGARKAAKFVSFCDNFSIPVITYVDCEGFEYSAENEKTPFASELSKLAMVYASSTNAKVTVVTGSAIGSAFTLLGSKALGADVVFATPEAKIAALSTEAALEFIYGDKIYGTENALENKENFKKEWETKVASPVAAARNGDVDDVVEAAAVRGAVASALEMLSTKATKAPYRKHGNMPL